jgi:hypothetical protein
MTAKKSDASEQPTTENVDMDHIRDLMGPLPYEKGMPVIPQPKMSKIASESPTKPIVVKSAPVVHGAHQAVADAANEANQALIALSPEMGKSKIIKVENEPVIIRPDETPEDEKKPDLIQTPKPSMPFLPTEGVVADDPVLVGAVNDIVAHESDVVLEAEDDKLDDENESKKEKTGLWVKIKSLWSHPVIRWTIIIGLLLIILAAALYPISRYYVLNTAGVRASVNLKVIDNSTLQPLKNVSVTVGGVTALTDNTGDVKLTKVKLGKASIAVSKRAFTTVTQAITVGWGSNPEGQVRLVASGTQYSFIVTDYLSGKPIEKVQASSGEGNATSDKNGKVVLTLDTSGKSDNDELVIAFDGNNYRRETAKITAGNKEVGSIKLVLARKDVFVSKRDKTYDIYSVDIDGKNEKKIVTGTGIERGDMQLSTEQGYDVAAFVATRENAKNTEGYLLSTLYLLDTKSGTLSKVDQSEQIQLVGWSSDGHLVYVKIAAGASAANPKRNRLMSLSTKNSSDNKELTSANALNDVVMAGDAVLYAPSNALQDNPKPGLFVVNADGSNAFTITDKAVQNIFRTSYDGVTINASGTYYTYKIGAAASTLTATGSLGSINRLYIDNTSGTKSMWVDAHTTKAALTNFDKITKKDLALATQNGLQSPIAWLDDSTVMYRVNDGKEVADYVLSLNGGNPKKISDVSDVGGISRWYYY